MPFFQKIIVFLLCVLVGLCFLIFFTQQYQTQKIITFIDWYMYNMEFYEESTP